MKNSNLLYSILAIGLLHTTTNGRTWTSADGSKKVEAELKSYNEAKGIVVVTKTNGQTITFKESILSPEDIAFVKTEVKKAAVEVVSETKTTAKKLPDVLPDPDGKEADMNKPVKVFILMGQSNMLGFGKTSGLKAATVKGLYPYLVDDSGSWNVRKDVRNVRVMCSGSKPWKQHFNGWLSGDNGSGAGGGKFGPEIGIGHYVGHVLDEPVLILKTCIGNRSLGYDLLPPSAPGYEGNKDDAARTPKPGGWYAGVQYDGDTRAAKEVLKDLKTFYPGAKDYEVAGFLFWQGAKDLGKGAKYEENLVHFIKDLRKDFNAPNAPFVCATMGQQKKGATVTDAQLAVDGKTGKYPEFKDNVATFYSNLVSKGGSANGHYSGNAETYMNIGDGMGRLMAELLAK